MAGVTYILDTNVISDLLKGHPNVQARLRNAMQQDVAIAARLGAIIVSSDADFDALPVPRHDWRRDLSRSPAV